MKQYFPTVATLALTLIGSALAPALKADEWNKKTTITINQAIQVEQTELTAGSYVLKLLDSPYDRQIVQIFNADENRLIATIFAIPAYRLRPLGDSKFQFYEAAAGQPPALSTWFYPGDNFGFEFRPARSEVATLSAKHPQSDNLSNHVSD